MNVEVTYGGVYDAKRNTFTDDFGTTVGNLHSENECKDRNGCVVHRQSEHSMSKFPLLLRTDRFIWERICPHGIGHPDPDDMEWHESRGRDYEGVHGCDGCCAS